VPVVEKKESSQISDLRFHLRKLDKQEQMKPKFSRRMDIKIRAEVIENREVYRSSIKPEVSSLRASVRFVRPTRQERVESHKCLEGGR